MQILIGYIVGLLKDLLIHLYLSIKALILKKQIHQLKEEADEKRVRAEASYGDFMAEYKLYESELHKVEPSSLGTPSGDASNGERPSEPVKK